MRTSRSLPAALIVTAACTGAAHALIEPSVRSPERPPASVESVGIEEAARAVVDIRVEALKDGRSLKQLGPRRRGSGVVIDDEGDILTSVYLVLEADDIEVISESGDSAPAKILASDFESGIAILTLEKNLPVESLELGSADSVGINEPAVAISSSGSAQIVGVTYVVAKRPYNSGWEFVVNEGIFTRPPFAGWNGAALVNERGELIGIGSLLIRASGRPVTDASKIDALGTMFVSIDEIRPVLGELIARGRRLGPERPWIGVLTRQLDSRCEITGVMSDSPADNAGLEPHDVIVAINAREVKTQRKLYDALWNAGPAGTPITVTVRRGGDLRDIEVKSVSLSSYYLTDPAN